MIVVFFSFFYNGHHEKEWNLAILMAKMEKSNEENNYSL